MDNVTERDIRSWCWWPGLPVGQPYKAILSVHCHMSVSVLMTLDVARTLTNKKQSKAFFVLQLAYIHTLIYIGIYMCVCMHICMYVCVLAYTMFKIDSVSV